MASRCSKCSIDPFVRRYGLGWRWFDWRQFDGALAVSWGMLIDGHFWMEDGRIGAPSTERTKERPRKGRRGFRIYGRRHSNSSTRQQLSSPRLSGSYSSLRRQSFVTFVETVLYVGTDSKCRAHLDSEAKQQEAYDCGWSRVHV
jgi:hypothetical protein